MELKNYINGHWRHATGTELTAVLDPTTGDILAQTRSSSAEDVDMAVTIAAEAFSEWQRTPPTERIKPLLELRALMAEYSDEIAGLIVYENGKTMAEAQNELRRAIANVDAACGISSTAQGLVSERVAAGVNDFVENEPIGVVGIITPFNFPVLFPFWFIPTVVATGNSFVLKPSARAPLSMQMVIELMEVAGFPRGVVNMVHGEADTANAIIDHPVVKAIGFVGKTAVSQQIYTRATANGKRVHVQTNQPR